MKKYFRVLLRSAKWDVESQEFIPLLPHEPQRGYVFRIFPSLNISNFSKMDDNL